MSRTLSADSDEPILERVASYYTAKLAQHGATPQGVDWKDDASHELRHQQFLRLLDASFDASVLDLGCGYGDFFRFLRDNGYRGLYIGYDIASSMVAAAARLHGEGADRRWRIGAHPEETAEFAVASGIFNVKGDIPDERWRRYVEATIDLLARVGCRGFAFNVLTSTCDPERRRPDLYYADPSETLALCIARFGRNVALLQDYGLYEFTVIVRLADQAS